MWDELLRAHLIRQIAQIFSRRIHRHSRPGFASAGAILIGPRDVAGAQAARRGGSEIAAVRRDHHAFCRREIEHFACCEIDARHRFVIAGNFRAEDRVPGKIVASREIDHQ